MGNADDSAISFTCQRIALPGTGTGPIIPGMPARRSTTPDPLDELDSGRGLTLDLFVTFRINQLSMAFERQWTRFMREQVGLSLGEWRVVAILHGLSPATFAQVVQRLGMNKSLCSRCVASLQEQGLVQAGPTPGDARSVTLTLTAAGRRLVHRLRPLVIGRQRMLLQALTEAERRMLYGALDKLDAAAASWGEGQGWQAPGEGGARDTAR